MRDVAIIGVGMTKFGELWEKSFRELGIEAGLTAIKDANISAQDIGAVYVGNMSAGKFIDQEHVGALIADYAGLIRNHIPAIRVEAAGASGSLALHQAYIAVASGLHNIVVVGGAEKMTDVGKLTSDEILASAADQEWESVFGATYSGLHAMVATRYAYEYIQGANLKAKIAQLRRYMASVAVKNHFYGALNKEKAHFSNRVKKEQVLNAEMVAFPLSMFDCSPISDGAAAVVLCPLEKAKKFTSTPIKILGSGQAGDTLALSNRRDLCTIDSTVMAGKRAYVHAGITPKDVDVAEVHDSFTISEILAVEDLQFAKKGEGGKFIEQWESFLLGEAKEKPNGPYINTSGGLKARGDPIGATGIAQVVEIVTQLRGKAGERQVPDAKIGLTHNLGGTGASAVVHIFARCE